MKRGIASLWWILLSLIATFGAHADVKPSIADCRAEFGSLAPGEYEVDITFSGIGVYDRHEDQGFVDLIMPNLVSGKPPLPDLVNAGENLREDIPGHIAYVLAHTDEFQPTIDAGVRLEPAAYEGTCYKYFRLDGVIVTADDGLQAARANKPVCDTDKSDGTSCPTADTKGSMYWIPRLRIAAGEAANDTTHQQTPKNPDFFPVATNNTAVALNPAKVAARIRIDRGYLETAVVSGAIHAFRVRLEDATDRGQRQAIAQEVHWHFRAQANPFVLRLSNGTTLQFAPPKTGPLKIFIANNPVSETGPIRIATNESRDDHFSAYYDFIKNFDPENGAIPFVAGSCDATTLANSAPSLISCARCKSDPNCTLEARSAFLNLLRVRRKGIGASHGHHSALGSLPSGLNCGGTQWP